MLEHLESVYPEGIDAANEVVFETQHPYTKSFVTKRETIQVDRAIGYIVEVDPRCSTRNDDHRVTYEMSLTSDDNRWCMNADDKSTIYRQGNKLCVEFSRRQADPRQFYDNRRGAKPE